MARSAGSAIRDAWMRSGMSQRDFANSLDISRSSLQRYMRGEAQSKAQAVVTDARILAYSKRHSSHASEKYAYTLREREAGRSVRLGKREILGDEAVKIKDLYKQVNQERKKIGLSTISPRGFFGKRENIESVLTRQLNPDFLRSTQQKGREGLKTSFAVFLERRDSTRLADKIIEKMDALTGDQLDRLFYDYRQQIDEIIEDSDRYSKTAEQVYTILSDLIEKVTDTDRPRPAKRRKK